MKSIQPLRLALQLLGFLLGPIACLAASPTVTDTLIFGDVASEQNHRLAAEGASIVTGGLGEPARQLLPSTPASWQGGSIKFTLKVDPAKPNYATVRFWGSDVTKTCLVLYGEGKQIGYRHLGDIDILDVGNGSPAFNDRFIYVTTPLPETLTKGRTEISLEIRSSGPMWGYGATFERFQLPMTAPSRGLYRISSHTEGYFAPAPDEKQGQAIPRPPVRSTPGAEVLDELKDRVSREVQRLMTSPEPINQMQMQFLARAWHVKWTPAYQSDAAIAQLLHSLDAIFFAYRKNPRLAASDPATYNADWFGLGPSGDVLRLVAAPLQARLDLEIDDGLGRRITRRAGFTEMLVACRDWHRRNRRLYTNQSMINDLYGIYLANRGVAILDPAQAWPEPEIRRYLYESVGLEPWRDSDPGGEGPRETGGRAWGVGADYWQLTKKGLTKELGYVGYYGEVLDWATAIYEATRPAIGRPGDEKLHEQLVRMAKARAFFRYPMLDAEGFRAMRIEAIVGWRDAGHYPGDIAYAQRTSWDGSALEAVAATLAPELVGYAQQMFADGQFFALLQDFMRREKGFRATAGLLGVPDQYALVESQPPSPHRLPMTPGQPDFVFTDEEDGVVAVKDGANILYASLYWRARTGINYLARVHYTTPETDHIAVVRQQTEFEPSGMTDTRPDHTTFGFGNGGPRYPGEVHSAHAGEPLPIPKIPADVPFRAGQESVYAGRGDFYTLRYGSYLIAMNMSKNRTFALKPPVGVGARELVSGRVLDSAAPIQVAPRSTIILRLP